MIIGPKCILCRDCQEYQYNVDTPWSDDPDDWCHLGKTVPNDGSDDEFSCQYYKRKWWKFWRPK